MKTWLYIIAVIVGLGISWVACQKPDPPLIDEYFFVKNKGAEMPVWARGNTIDRSFIIMLHGGPGGTAQVYAEFDAIFEEVIEKENVMVYWDQRGSGDAQGNFNKTNQTVAQYVEDLHHVVLTLEERYDNPTIFLMGHSWGGTLGTAYLLDEERAAHITGWIEVNGAHNVVLGYELQREYIITQADSFLRLREEVDKWQRIRQWCVDNADIQRSGQRDTIWMYMIEAGGQDNVSTNGPSLRELFRYTFCSQHSPLVSDLNNRITNFRLNEEVEQIALSPEMHVITLPVSIIWGVQDGVTPVGLARDAFDAIGTPDEDKFLHLYENSAHSPMFDEPDRFAQDVLDFVDRYK